VQLNAPKALGPRVGATGCLVLCALLQACAGNGTPGNVQRPRSELQDDQALAACPGALEPSGAYTYSSIGCSTG
jgi:hypothetical protein